MGKYSNAKKIPKKQKPNPEKKVSQMDVGTDVWRYGLAKKDKQDRRFYRTPFGRAGSPKIIVIYTS